MKFNELPLYEAVYDVVQQMIENGESPGSDKWTMFESETLARRIQQRLPIGAPFTKSEMMDAWIRFRKSVGRKAELIVETARKHGRHCFYRGRGLGECSDELSIDRIIPGSRGGQYDIRNCVIACLKHNEQRGDLSIEEYLSNAL